MKKCSKLGEDPYIQHIKKILCRAVHMFSETPAWTDARTVRHICQG